MLLLRESLDLTTVTLTCPAINVEFPLHIQQPGVGIPVGTQFDKHTFTATPRLRLTSPKITLSYIILLHVVKVPMLMPQLIPTNS